VAVAAGGVKSEDDRPAAPEKERAKIVRIGITIPLSILNGSLDLID
jgi:hypothetical protein